MSARTWGFTDNEVAEAYFRPEKIGPDPTFPRNERRVAGRVELGVVKTSGQVVFVKGHDPAVTPLDDTGHPIAWQVRRDRLRDATHRMHQALAVIEDVADDASAYARLTTAGATEPTDPSDKPRDDDPGIEVIAVALAGAGWTFFDDDTKQIVRRGARDLLHQVDRARKATP